MAASKSPRARLLHIRDEIEGVATIVRGLSFVQYQGSYMHRRAVERAVQIVSEAAKALPPDFLAKYPNAPMRLVLQPTTCLANVARMSEATSGFSGIPWFPHFAEPVIGPRLAPTRWLTRATY